MSWRTDLHGGDGWFGIISKLFLDCQTLVQFIRSLRHGRAGLDCFTLVGTLNRPNHIRVFITGTPPD
jgi:hypothetical protein